MFAIAALPLLSAILVTTLSYQAANAQLTAAQQQAVKSMVATGYTNHFPINPPAVPCPTCQTVTIPYSIKDNTLSQAEVISADSRRMMSIGPSLRDRGAVFSFRALWTFEK